MTIPSSHNTGLSQPFQNKAQSQNGACIKLKERQRNTWKYNPISSSWMCERRRRRIWEVGEELGSHRFEFRVVREKERESQGINFTCGTLTLIWHLFVTRHLLRRPFRIYFDNPDSDLIADMATAALAPSLKFPSPVTPWRRRPCQTHKFNCR